MCILATGKEGKCTGLEWSSALIKEASDINLYILINI